MNQAAFNFYRPVRASNGKALAEAGMKKVLDKEIKAWLALAEDRACKLATAGIMFTIEDVEDTVGPPPRHFNSAGALMHTLARQGKIEWTGQMMPSSKASRRGSLVRFWRGVSK